MHRLENKKMMAVVAISGGIFQSNPALANAPDPVEMASVAVNTPGTINLMVLAVIALLIGRRRPK